MQDISGLALDDHETLLITIEERASTARLEAIFSCLFDGHPAVRSFFGEQSHLADRDLYRFVFSDYAYGRVLVDSRSAQDYFGGKTGVGLSILKLTYDFDETGRAVVGDIFGFRKSGHARYEFSAFDGTAFVPRSTECLTCHDAKPERLFFKQAFRHKLTDD